MMGNVILYGKRSQPRIFVQKGEASYVTPYWISDKGNLCWKLGQTLYVKLKSGFTMMLDEDDKWVPADAKTKATAPKAEGLAEAQTE